ncbi:shikimate dehydrogenase [Pullulanibacillus sp. KACC 23026]|uniref:shikimate dehydrogenase n=1 Tax=Pullulanibacillus sp. KACC 23026 TaxID=3028315 RepID=UPI0023B18CA1|nr:shikimate dehydrogenase [Pullulanibacillus sp. KACC 23026]WEG14202.1 shikimate dehydrogenase [Pullulanibacillus sp. KACC 23026]
MSFLLGVLGDPIGHSLSPIMHNRWYKEWNYPHYYHAFRLSKENLSDGVKGLKALQFKGFNVTIPHKVDILSLLDELDDEASELGAVNTVVQEKGRLKGYNTDGRGLISAINEKWPTALEKAKVLMIGAGGASLGVALTLAKSGVSQVDVTNRTIEKAEAISQKCSPFVQTKALSLTEAEETLGTYTMVIQSTSLGMGPHGLDQMPLVVNQLQKGTYCIDLIYNPLQTRWLKEAEEKGALTMNGLPMLVHQGALSFEHWFGVMPDTASMITFLTQHLEETHANR